MTWSFGGIPDRFVRRLRRQFETFESVAIGHHHATGVIDTVEMNDDGTLIVAGWAPDAHLYAADMELRAGETSILPTHVFRVLRPDLAKRAGDHPNRMGVIVEFILPPQWSKLAATLLVQGRRIATFQLPAFTQPAYYELYGSPGVWHRDDVYGVGPPARTVSSEILSLCSDLQGPLLDFGCGAGNLVAALRAGGIEARGLELDTADMRDAVVPEARPHVTYYSGIFPAPFTDRAFESVTCCEVLEHIPDFEGAVKELSRLARTRLLVTVPDMSAIPRGYRHNVVPWHLLERSHVNFFTQQSLDAVLSPHFRDVEIFRIGEVRCGRMRFYTSLVARCER